MRFSLSHFSALIPVLLAAVCTVQTGCTSGPEANSETFANGRPVGEIRGTALVNAQIKRRLLTEESADGFQIERVAGPEVFSLRGLLGEYSTGSAHTEFRGGEPNPFGLLLWHQVAARFAEGLGSICAQPQGTRSVKFFGTDAFTLTDAFGDKLAANCEQNLTEAELKSNATSLWRAFVGIGASGEENVFASFFSGADFVPANPSERVTAMVLTMVLNPHFLLEK
jgi:hypothetical protein